MTTAAVHEASLAAALDALEILSDERCTWMGEPVAWPRPVLRNGPPERRREALIRGVTSRLYESFYITGGPVAVPRCANGRSGQRGLSEALAAANFGTGRIDPDWRVVARDGDRWVVTRDELRLWARRDEVVADGPGEPRPGDLVAVRMPSDAPEWAPGFYLASGNRGFSAEELRALDRFYLNLREEGAIDFIRLATRRLNHEGLAFRAKVVDERGGFDRCDSALLVTARGARARALPAVLGIHAALIDRLEPATPALTRRLAPGLAFAEDPGSGESYGAHRCRLIAAGIVEAHERGLVEPGGRLNAVRERFASAGISLEAPYLGPGSPGDLESPSMGTTPRKEPARWR